MCSSPPAEIKFVKKLQPKLSEIRIDLFAIKNIVSEELGDGVMDFERWGKGRRLGFCEGLKGESESETRD
ncbi:hypothetical protein RYX36_004438 [Vicia faba]